jgi:hypothetical protein
MYVLGKARITITRCSGVAIADILWEGGRVTHWKCGPFINLVHPAVRISVSGLDQIHCTYVENGED